jgi:hypothetical protein
VASSRSIVRDGNGTRSFETLLRYRGAAMAEFWRALRTLKALQAEQAAGLEMSAGGIPQPSGRAVQCRTTPRRPRTRNEPRPQAQPDEPERAAPSRPEYVVTEPSLPDRMLHEPAALWLPNEPESGRAGCAGIRRAASGRLA